MTDLNIEESAITLIPVDGFGPEDALPMPDGALLAGVENGQILRVDPAGGGSRPVCETGGRPLGMEHLPDGRVVVCDNPRGLLALDPVSGALEALAER